MTPYETLFVIHPDQGGRVKELIEKFRTVVEGQGGSVAQVDEWGLRDLAYRIQKQSRGYYVLFQYNATGRAVDEFERNMRLTDGLLRYLTVRVDEASDAAAEPRKTEPAARRPQEESAKPEA